MKKLGILFTTAALPFLLVWAAYFLTGFSFSTTNVFQDGVFWGLSIMYWILWICMLGPIVELIDASVDQKK